MRRIVVSREAQSCGDAVVAGSDGTEDGVSKHRGASAVNHQRQAVGGLKGRKLGNGIRRERRIWGWLWPEHCPDCLRVDLVGPALLQSWSNKVVAVAAGCCWREATSLEIWPVRAAPNQYAAASSSSPLQPLSTSQFTLYPLQLFPFQLVYFVQPYPKSPEGSNPASTNSRRRLRQAIFCFSSRLSFLPEPVMSTETPLRTSGAVCLCYVGCWCSGCWRSGFDMICWPDDACSFEVPC